MPLNPTSPLLSLPPEIVRQGLDIADADLQAFLQSHSPAVDLTESELSVGRCRLARRKTRLASTAMAKRFTYAFTKPALRLMEQLAVCVRRYEPVLLVGETGTGKTSTVQHLARSLNQEYVADGRWSYCSLGDGPANVASLADTRALPIASLARLVVINMSQQSDSADLLGGFKPVNIRALSEPILDKFRKIFFKTFSRKQNAPFVGKVGGQLGTAVQRPCCRFSEPNRPPPFFYPAALRSRLACPPPKQLELALARERWDVLLKGLRNALIRVRYVASRACTTLPPTIAKAIALGCFLTFLFHWSLFVSKPRIRRLTSAWSAKTAAQRRRAPN